jgi:SAM-dependent methyltransferase
LRRLDRVVGARVFGTDAAGYHAGRIGYPEELYDAIADYAGPVGKLLEIGPGTGLATQVLLDRFSPDALVAVEADPSMAEHLSKLDIDSRLQIVTGDFLTVPLATGFDLAACAAAFHWLQPESALARLRQLLRPAGAVALWWNSYRQVDIGDPFADAVTPLLNDISLPPSEGASGHYSLDVDLHREALTGAGLVRFEPHLFRRERTIDLAALRALYGSYSYVRALPEPRRGELLDAIIALAQREFGDSVPNVVLSALYLASNPES